MPDGIVDIGDKPATKRRAVAAGRLDVADATLDAVRDGEIDKGDVLEAARVAALMAVKATPERLPHCHPIPITSVDVSFDLDDAIACTVVVEATYRTGVEMEALHGVSVALLTTWDMVKPYEKDDDGQYPATRIADLRVVEKKVLRE